MKTLILIFALLQSVEDVYKSANADFEAERWSEAAAKYDLVLKEDPTHIPSRFNLAFCYSRTGDIANAISSYQKVLEQDGNLYEARVNLAVLLDQDGKRSEAGEQFEKALSLRPDDAEAHLNIGMFYLRDEENEKAYPHLTTAAEKGINSPELYVALSELEHARQNESKSRSYLERASELDPDNRSIRRQLGIIYREA